MKGYKPKILDPLKFIRLVWPHIELYDKQIEILYSLRDNDETVVPAGNELGKDFITGLGCLWFFCSRNPVRIVTTSVDGTQLSAVLWGEIRRFLQDAKVPLPIEQNDLHLHRIVKGQRCGLSYMIGRVAAAGEGMLGHHIANTGDGIPRTLFVGDESSGIRDDIFEKVESWAVRKLIIGNPYPCTNRFYRAVKQGDVPRPDGDGYYQRVIHISADDSPNVMFAKAQMAHGIEPTGEVIIPGVKSWEKYVKHRDQWDEKKQCIGLDGKFYEGNEVYLFPPAWLNAAEQIARDLELSKRPRRAKAMGVDTAEGGDSSVWCVVDELGIIDLISKKTPDTAVIPGETLALMRRYGLTPENILFDAGGGGRQHADRLRKMGYNVRVVAFGSEPTAPLKRGLALFQEKVDDKENRFTYKNKRAEMYGTIRLMLDSSYNPLGFGIPAKYVELRRQMEPIPLWYDDEGKLYLPPKKKKPDQAEGKTKKLTLFDLIGRSPDDADAFALAVYGMICKPPRRTAGAIA